MSTAGTALSPAQMRRIRAFALKHCAQNDFNHNAAHVELTVRWARYLARTEGADVRICEAAAYLHDIARNEAGLSKKHGPPGAQLARAFLQSIRVDTHSINAVCYAVGQHDSGGLKKTREAEILWDADKLQSIGPYGYLRIVAHHLHYDTRDIMRAHALTIKRHRFFLRRFYTRTGRRIARHLHGCTAVFCGMLEASRIPDAYALDKETA